MIGKEISLRDKVASFFHRLARKQAHFFWWLCERFFSHFKNRSQRSSLPKRKRRMILRICSALLAIPLLCWTLLLAETELLTRISAHVLATTPFTYLKGESAEKILKNKEALTIFSLNTCFVPGGFSFLFGGVPPWKERIEGVIEKIKEKNPDILCLQEVNDVEAAFRLYEALKGQYAHFYLNIGPKVLSQNSGLFVASKFAISDPSFVSFEALQGVQKVVNKGFFECKILSGSKILAHLFTTHLSPSKDDLEPTPLERKVRQEELAMILANAEKSSPGALVILAGDLNIAREHKEALSLEGFRDLFPKGAKSSGTKILVSAFLAKTKEEIMTAKKRFSEFALDYILVKKNAPCKAEISLVKTYDLRETDPTKKALSDHHALFAVLRPKA